jgi:hypothetical protein
MKRRMSGLMLTLMLGVALLQQSNADASTLEATPTSVPIEIAQTFSVPCLNDGYVWVSRQSGETTDYEIVLDTCETLTLSRALRRPATVLPLCNLAVGLVAIKADLQNATPWQQVVKRCLVSRKLAALDTTALSNKLFDLAQLCGVVFDFSIESAFTDESEMRSWSSYQRKEDVLGKIQGDGATKKCLAGRRPVAPSVSPTVTPGSSVSPTTKQKPVPKKPTKRRR